MATTATKPTELTKVNLLDILPLMDIKQGKSADETKRVTEFNNLVNRTQNFINEYLEYFDANRMPNELEEKFKYSEKINKSRLDFLQKYSYLPKDMLTRPYFRVDPYTSKKYMLKLVFEDDIISKLASSKVISGSDVYDIVNKFEFIAIPYELFDQNTLNSEPDNYSLKNKINRFNRLKDIMNVYVICPVQYYSLQNHIEHSTITDIYTGKHSNTFASVSMNIPIFKGVIDMVKNSWEWLFDSIATDLAAKYENIDERNSAKLKEIQEILNK